LEGVLAKRKSSLLGILNGIDYSIWNPKTDKIIAKIIQFRICKVNRRIKRPCRKYAACRKKPMSLCSAWSPG